MPNTLIVITEPAEIAELNSSLKRRLAKTFRNIESREIAYPAGQFTADVYFESKHGKVVRAWAPRNDEDKLLNFILAGEPGASAAMEISVQLNFPAGQYSRRMAGAFIRDSNGDVLIGHRGKLTKGRAALKQREVLREFTPRLVEAQDGNRTSRIILISSLDAPDLADRLWDFAIEAREVATRLGTQRDAREGDDEPDAGAPSQKGSRVRRIAKRPPTPADRLLVLRKYFDEFAGTTELKGYGGGKRAVEHGDIVKALEAQLAKKGETQKAQAIDLAVVSASNVDLFEVKTSARTTDVYTGVGQLLIHGESVSERLALPVRRYLVLPEQPNREHARHMLRKGHMQIVIYQKTIHGYRFKGM